MRVELSLEIFSDELDKQIKESLGVPEEYFDENAELSPYWKHRVEQAKFYRTLSERLNALIGEAVDKFFEDELKRREKCAEDFTELK